MQFCVSYHWEIKVSIIILGHGKHPHLPTLETGYMEGGSQLTVWPQGQGTIYQVEVMVGAFLLAKIPTCLRWQLRERMNPTPEVFWNTRRAATMILPCPSWHEEAPAPEILSPEEDHDVSVTIRWHSEWAERILTEPEPTSRSTPGDCRTTQDHNFTVNRLRLWARRQRPDTLCLMCLTACQDQTIMTVGWTETTWSETLWSVKHQAEELKSRESYWKAVLKSWNSDEWKAW